MIPFTNIIMKTVATHLFLFSKSSHHRFCPPPFIEHKFRRNNSPTTCCVRLSLSSGWSGLMGVQWWYTPYQERPIWLGYTPSWDQHIWEGLGYTFSSDYRSSGNLQLYCGHQCWSCYCGVQCGSDWWVQRTFSWFFGSGGCMSWRGALLASPNSFLLSSPLPPSSPHSPLLFSWSSDRYYSWDPPISISRPGINATLRGKRWSPWT